jgi:hypothetical protein
MEPRIAPATFAPLPGLSDDATNPSSLRAAIAEADSNADAVNTIVLAAGTYSITGSTLAIADQAATVPAKTLVIEGVAGQTTIANSDQQAFSITSAAGAGMTATIENVTITGGTVEAAVGSDSEGAGLLIDGAAVSLDHVTISNETTFGGPLLQFDPIQGMTPPGIPPGNGRGGAVYLAGGTLSLQDDAFTNDSAKGGLIGGSAFGGAIYVAGGTLTATDVSFSDNTAGGSPDYGGGSASGGSLYIANGSVALTNVSIESSSAEGGAGASSDIGTKGSDAFGGGIAIAGGRLALDRVTIESNSAVGGNGSNGGYQGSYTPPQSITGLGGNGGNAEGGGLSITGGTVTALDSTITGNSVQAGTGGLNVLTGSPGSTGSRGMANGENVANEGGSYTATTSPVTVLSVQWQRRDSGHKTKRDVLLVTFSAALNPGDAQDRSAYDLLLTRRHAHGAKPIKLNTAVYDPNTDTVTLTPKMKELPSGRLELQIDTLSILDSVGRPVNDNSGGSLLIPVAPRR